MSKQDMKEINDLLVLDYDVFGKCNDMMSFIKSTQPVQKDDPQICKKVSAVAKLINQLIKFLKDSDNSNLNNLPDYYDIVYLLNNNLQNNLTVQAKKMQLIEASNYELKNQITIQTQKIQQLNKDLQIKDKENQQLRKEIKALKHQIQQLEYLEFQVEQEMNNQNQSLNEDNNLLQNEITQLKYQIELKENTIKYQEGEIKLLKLQLQRIQGDQRQDIKHHLFYEQQQIFKENQELLNKINQLSFKNNYQPIENVQKGKEHQNVKENKIQSQQIEIMQNRIFNFLNQLSLHGFLISAWIGAYMQPINDINVDEVLKGLSNVEGANGFVIFNQDCIPLKRSEKNITYDKAVHMSALVADLWNVTKKCIQRELRSADNDLEIIRIRTKAQSEYIISQQGDFTMIGIQLCGKAIEEAKLAAAVEAQAAAEAEKAKKGDKEQS
ncbi:unnamed protein product [Paramecium pentaurelia]|uniref:Roadblock/LAMTOR2 domain-containing protein n=2 Tax=Paramecium TaxID=5884 RepID=A0A8S1U2Z1_9CILI|nr:unnamed protein product [Paramecium pentaurelia]